MREICSRQHVPLLLTTPHAALLHRRLLQRIVCRWLLPAPSLAEAPQPDLPEPLPVRPLTRQSPPWLRRATPAAAAVLPHAAGWPTGASRLSQSSNADVQYPSAIYAEYSCIVDHNQIHQQGKYTPLACLPGLGLQAALGNLASGEVLLQLVNSTLHLHAVIVYVISWSLRSTHAVSQTFLRSIACCGCKVPGRWWHTVRAPYL